MLNNLFSHLRKIDKINKTDTTGEHRFSLPCYAREEWIRNTLLNPDAIATMKVIDGPHDTSAQTNHVASGSVVLQSLRDSKKLGFQDLTVKVSWYDDGFGMVGFISSSSIDISYTQSGRRIASIRAIDSYLGKSIYQSIVARQQKDLTDFAP